MSSSKNHYETLGVLIDADEFIIKAAYKALAQHYHPDRYQGDTDFAEKKIREINEAYSIIGDPAKRNKYNESLIGEAIKIRSYLEDCEFLEEKSLAESWRIACEYYPELALAEERLLNLSPIISFVYRSLILDGKLFSQADALAKKIEQSFLSIFFGGDLRIISLARFLINSEKNEAASDLSKTVQAIGCPENYDLIFKRFSEKHIKKCSPAEQQFLYDVSKGNFELAKNALEGGIYIDAVNESGLTALDIAKEKNDYRMISLIESYSRD